ncbi:MAG: ABC transporter permease [Gammaproteobacteria bacterium]|nr:ABC transporter permease [Gammaproteobacteria bacterium]
MLRYYCELAARSLWRTPVLSSLMVLAIAVGVGASMTSLAVLRLLSGDPLPGRSQHLYYVQLDPRPLGKNQGNGEPPMSMTYTDAMNLLRAHRADRQAVMYDSVAPIVPPDPDLASFYAHTWVTTADFFPMFSVAFRYGGPWRTADDQSRARVAVISTKLNNKLFHGENSVGQILQIGDHRLRVIGVIGNWRPAPLFYVAPAMAAGQSNNNYGSVEDVFLPLLTARELQLLPNGIDCESANPDLSHLETTECGWLLLWVELDSAAKAADYRKLLVNYSQEQKSVGRFQRPPNVRLRDVNRLLSDLHVVPNDVRLQTWIAFGFLLVCIVNTVGLLLAKFLRRAYDVGVRRAFGATRGAIFVQYLLEALAVGIVGGGFGLALTAAGLWWMRHRPRDYASLIHLDPGTVGLTILVAIAASLLAGLLPAWRACRIPPALQLKEN